MNDLNLDKSRQELIQFSHEMEEIEKKRKKRQNDIIESNLDILNEIEIVKTRLNLLFVEEKKVSFYPHKVTIRQHITESQIYLADLYGAYQLKNNNYNYKYKLPVVKQKKEFQKKLDIVIDDLTDMMI